ncbi:hypothetical protein FA95DRAFT_1209131 [Auriscalpium vulgare]|uniref:Uncharacterized protein n=1 Tax=Auriscalpium vulgare TaxID=40419 RepID=A0ACB8RUM4_9AGAM|nr:hypothetical protein FA95DRAFT_1209131 [Auriscalpium vulgare]
MYTCRVIHPLLPPDDVSYRGLPFFTLVIHGRFDILNEVGPTNRQSDLPLTCVRDVLGRAGWALASFLWPVHRDRILDGDEDCVVSNPSDAWTERPSSLGLISTLGQASFKTTKSISSRRSRLNETLTPPGTVYLR